MKNYINYTLDGEKFTIEKENANQIFFEAAKLICFADCNGAHIDKIVCDGKEYEYVGWQPAMVFEFCDALTKEVVWSHQFLFWDH